MSADKPTDSDICQRIKRGWLRPYLVILDQMFSKRWDYWSRTLEAGEVLDEPIPGINWLDVPHNEPKKNLQTCITLSQNRGHRNAFDLFVDWLLYGFGHSLVQELPSQIEPQINAGWYKTFNLGLYLKYPYDYLGQYAAELYGNGKHNPTAYFPTPMHHCDLMVKMLMDKTDKTASVCDPCVGSGRLLMAASNYSLNLYGMDIDPLILKVCHLNMFMYVPWGVCRPKTLKGLDDVQKPRQQGGSLMRTPIQHPTPEVQQDLLEAVQLSLFDDMP